MARHEKGSMGGQTFDDFLAGQGLLQACENHAIKEIIAAQLAAAMKERGLFVAPCRFPSETRPLPRLRGGMENIPVYPLLRMTFIFSRLLNKVDLLILNKYN